VSRILFVMLHPGFVRYYDDALHALADAGHDVHVAFEVSRTKLGEDVTAARLGRSSPRITCGVTPARVESVREFLARGDRTAARSGEFGQGLDADARASSWESLATTIRLLADYLRFFEPEFAAATKLRARAEKRLPRIYVSAVGAVAALGAWARHGLAAGLRAAERAIPASASIVAFLREQRPDLLLVTPLIELGSQQVDYVKAARGLGLRSALAVASWDNLTSKGLVRVQPGHVIVWNEAQKREAVTLHGVPADRVRVTGAQLFDRWFTASPSRSREAFCARVGLDPSRPFVLYAGSSSFIAPEEVPFAERWLGRLRGSSDPAVSGLGVLFRPHPANSRQWRVLEPSEYANVAVWPPIGTDPTDAEFKNDYFDSLFYSAAVVGVNTSAQLEAAIVGRPVYAVRVPEFAHAQAGTLHFQHLAGGGAVTTAATLEEHEGHLAALVAGRGPSPETARRFVHEFIRPLGLDQPAVPVFVGAVQGLLETPAPAPERMPLWAVCARPVMLVTAVVARALADDRPLWAYPLRVAVTVAVWLASLVYGIAGAWSSFRTGGLKRLRRGTWRLWYESSQRLAGWMKVARHRLVKRLRHVGGAAKRAVRRHPIP
jgi:hypothetical protein